MNIAIVIASNTIGGAQRVACHLAKYISSMPNDNVYIVSLKRSNKDGYNMDEYNYVDLKGIKIIRSFRDVITRNNVDVVINMGVPICIYTILACIGLRTKVIVSERNDPMHFAGKKLTKVISRFFMTMADAYVFQTEEASEFYSCSKQKKSTVIPNPLMDTSQLPQDIYKGIRDKEFVTFGRLIPQKNHRVLLEAFEIVCNKYPDYKLVIWGEGECLEELKRYLKVLHIEDNVYFPGTTDDLIGNMYCKKGFVMSSDFEGMPNALMEAMAMGLPCISTDCPCGGPRALIQNKVNGVLVPVKNAKELATAMIYVIENDSAAESMGKKAFEIRDSFRMDIICKRWYDFILETISK